MLTTTRFSTRFASLVLALPLAILTGCAGLTSTAGPTETTIPAFHGNVHGGQTPIQGMRVVLYVTSASATGYGQAATIVGTSTTDVYGNFSISPVATSSNCPAGQQAYITAAGGYPTGVSASENTSVLMMAALGDCKNISSATTVQLNEVTTVAAGYALSSFLTTSVDPVHDVLGNSVYQANISAPVANNSSVTSITPTAPAGLAHAFLNATNLVNYATGLPNTYVVGNTAGITTNGSVPATLINTLADAMQACINGATGNTNCTNFFADTTSISGTTPTNTLQAFAYLARNPYTAASMSGTTGILNLVASSGTAFQPTLSTNPTDWSMAVVYNNGLPAPYWLALDANDTVFLGRSTTSATTSALWGLSPYGVSVPLFASPSALASTPVSRGIAPDALGNIWLANNANAADRFSTSTGSLLSTFTSAYGSTTGLAVDAHNNLWLTHVISGTTGPNIDEAAYNSTGPTWAVNYTATPTVTNTGGYGIGIDANQNVWPAGYYSGGTSAILLPNLGTAASPSYAASGTAITEVTATLNGTTPKPYSVVFDASGNAWEAITGSNSATTTGIEKVVPNSALGATSITPGSLIASTTLGATAAQMIAIDGAGTIFIPDNNSSTQGIHMYSTVNSAVLTPATGLKSTPSSVTSVTMTNVGAGYTSAPTVSFVGGGGTGAAGTATYNSTSNTITGVVVSAVGSGYTSAPTVVFTGGGTPTTPATGTANVLSIYNPRQIAVDSTGSIWAGFTIGGVTQIIGVAAPAYPLLSVGKPGLSPGLSAVNPLP